MDTTDYIYNEGLIKKKLIPYESPSRIVINDKFFTKSAVLFTIIPHSNRPYELVLIKRTEKGSRHRGEMAFPGGKFDLGKDKSLLDTALREAEEEIGIIRNNVKILGSLHDFPTMTRYVITAFIGVIQENNDLVKEPREVQEIVQVPIDFFMNPDNFSEQFFEFEGKSFPVFYYNYYDKSKGKKFTIWGATGYLIVSYIELVYDMKFSKIGKSVLNLEQIRSLRNYILYMKKFRERFL
jgi:8-oxo-dGTP pyrophosphatase MutT (NUDIX family)